MLSQREGRKSTLTVYKFAMACRHSLGCKALRTNIIRIKSTLEGATLGGRQADVMSHTAADIRPAGGEEYKECDC